MTITSAIIHMYTFVPFEAGKFNFIITTLIIDFHAKSKRFSLPHHFSIPLTKEKKPNRSLLRD